MARRGLMMAMAQGKEIIRGQFSANATGKYTINFGKTMTGRYMVYMEMTTDSKNAFAQVVSANRQYAVLWVQTGGCDYFSFDERQFSVRYNGSGITAASTTGNISMYNDRIEVDVYTVGGNAYTLYPYYTYDYMIIPIE